MEKLKDIRLSMSMSQYELAKKVGVNYRTISSYETGARDLPVKVAKKIGEVVNVNRKIVHSYSPKVVHLWQRNT